jgi:hypothetical protein
LQATLGLLDGDDAPEAMPALWKVQRELVPAIVAAAAAEPPMTNPAALGAWQAEIVKAVPPAARVLLMMMEEVMHPLICTSFPPLPWSLADRR